jgi:hypothetical protein
MSNYKTALR